MSYIEVQVKTTHQGEDLVADCFFDLELGGVSIVDKEDLISLNKKSHLWDYIEDDILEKYEDFVICKGLINKDEFDVVSKNLEECLSRLKANSEGFVDVGTLEVSYNELPDTDWLEEWKKNFKPLPIRDVVIVPKWIDYEKKPNEKTVLLNVGMAFGTGEHETTSMVIELMQDFDLENKCVFDIGCGSGILGIAAIKLGASKAIMSDIDETAVTAAIENAELNEVLQSCEISKANLLDGATATPDIVFSNITAEVLVLMASDMAKLLKKGQPLILSGILADRLDKIRSTYYNYFEEVKQIRKGDWCGITLKRK